LNVVESKALDVLQDIVLKVQIGADFCIQHPDYLPLTLPDAAVERFQQLSTELQNQYLKLKLTTVLHDLYFIGSQTVDEATEVSAEPLQNAGTMEQDWDFCRSLHASNGGTGYFDPGWSLLGETSDGSLMVQKQGLTLHIRHDRHLQATEQTPQVGDRISIRLPSNLFEHGCYVAVGNAGLVNGSYPLNHAGTLSVYFNLSPAGAVAVMQSLTQSLNQRDLPFTFKVRYDSADFHRYSTAVLSCQPGHYPSIRPLLEAIYAKYQDYFRPEVPLFAKALVPGLALAEEPLTPEHTPYPFGIHRCQLVASGLLAAWKSGDDTSVGRLAAIQQQFAAVGLDWQRPYLNPDSEDRYASLDEAL
jgi:hypothetical protein